MLFAGSDLGSVRLLFHGLSLLLLGGDDQATGWKRATLTARERCGLSVGNASEN